MFNEKMESLGGPPPHASLGQMYRAGYFRPGCETGRYFSDGKRACLHCSHAVDECICPPAEPAQIELELENPGWSKRITTVDYEKLETRVMACGIASLIKEDPQTVIDKINEILPANPPEALPEGWIARHDCVDDPKVRETWRKYQDLEKYREPGS